MQQVTELSRLHAVQSFWIIALKKLLADDTAGVYPRPVPISKHLLPVEKPWSSNIWLVLSIIFQGPPALTLQWYIHNNDQWSIMILIMCCFCQGWPLWRAYTSHKNHYPSATSGNVLFQGHSHHADHLCWWLDTLIIAWASARATLKCELMSVDGEKKLPGLSDQCPWTSIRKMKFWGTMLAPNRSPGLLFGSMGYYLAVILWRLSESEKHLTRS